MGAKEIVPARRYEHYDTRRYQSTHVQGGTIMGKSPEAFRGEHLGAALAGAKPVCHGRVHVRQQRLGESHTNVLAFTYRTADAVIDRYVKKPGMLG